LINYSIDSPDLTLFSKKKQKEKKIFAKTFLLEFGSKSFWRQFPTKECLGFWRSIGSPILTGVS